MELLVEIEKLVKAFGCNCSRPFVQDGLDAFNNLLVLATCRESGILSFEEGPHLDGFARFMLGHRRDSSAAPRCDFNQAFGSKRADCLPHRIA